MKNNNNTKIPNHPTLRSAEELNLFAAYHLNAESVLGLLFLIARYVRALSEEL